MFAIRRFLCLLLLSLCVSPAFATDYPEYVYTGDTEQILADGWTQTAPDIYERTIDGHHQTLSYGEASIRLELGWLDTEIASLTETYEKSGNPDFAVVVQNLEERRLELIKLQNETDDATVQRVDGMDLIVGSGIDDGGGGTGGGGTGGCGPSGTTVVSAGPGDSGARASASATVNDTCSGRAEIYCQAESRAYVNSANSYTIQADGPRSVYGPGSCSVSAEVAGDSNCFATSRSQIQFYNSAGSYVSQLADTISYNQCAPLWVHIRNPPSHANLGDSECVTQTIFGDSNRPGAHLGWSKNGGPPIAGSSIEVTHCNEAGGNGYTSTNTLELRGTAGTETDTDTTNYDVTYEPAAGCSFLTLDGICA